MKLIACHIENYGKISNTDIKFDNGLTSFCEANGYGKTTLASFLKAMFYGLDSDRANSGFNERRHFNPFGGGNFGGNITFTSGGKIYKAERYFDEKSETKDSFTLYIDGKAVAAPLNLGERIFGIDRESFERTIFISAAEIEISSTGSINSKLNNFIEGGTDNLNLETALERLESASKTYKKSRQGNDLITQENKRILRLTEKISNIEVIAAGLPGKYSRLEDTVRDIRELNEKISLAQNTNLVLNDWQHYDRMTEEIAKTEATVKAIESKYTYGIPTAEEIAQAAEAIENDKTLKAGAQQILFSASDETKYAALHLRFGNGVPDEAMLAETEKKIQQYTSLSYDIESLNKVETTQKEEKLKQAFAYHVPSQDEIAELDKNAERYTAAEKEYNSISDYISDTAPTPAAAPKVSNKLYIILAILAAILLAGGIAAVFFSLIAGIILLALGVIGLAITGFLYLNRKAGSHSAVVQGVAVENPQKLSLRRTMQSASDEIQAFLMPYGYTLNNGVAYAAATFKENVQSYNELLAAEDTNRRNLEKTLNRKQALSDEITAFFSGYNSAGNNFVRLMADLRSDIKEYQSLKSRKELSAANESELREKIAENRKDIAAFCDKYRFDIEFIAEKIKQIADDEKELSFASKALTEQKEKAIRFKKEKQLSERPAGQLVDLKELNEQLSELQDGKNSLLSEITSDEYEVEKLDDMRNELADSKGKSDGYKRTYELLRKTVESLQQADKRLKDKYVKPIKDQFVYYASVLEKTLGEKITMGADFEIRYERNGKERSEKYLSSGQRSICALCFRLALIDNMYSQEKPFLILDDPFVNLDEEHVGKVKVMLKELSQRLQIVYFTCHTSRAI